MNTDHWNRLFRAWSTLLAPRRVPDSVLASIGELIAPVKGETLMLGVTHGLAELGSDLTAIDRSETMVRTQWPGDIPSRRALVGDWLALPFAPHAFGTCLGDGVLNSLDYPGEITALLQSVAGILRPGGRFVCRVFTAPDGGETIPAVVRAAWQGEVDRFQSLKFRIGMAIASEQNNPNVAVQAIHRAFEANFPDRDRLAAETGWERKEIDTINLYAGSSVSYNFPTRRQCSAAVPSDFENVRFVNVPNYHLAERYPLLVADRP